MVTHRRRKAPPSRRPKGDPPVALPRDARLVVGPDFDSDWTTQTYTAPLEYCGYLLAPRLARDAQENHTINPAVLEIYRQIAGRAQAAGLRGGSWDLVYNSLNQLYSFSV